MQLIEEHGLMLRTTLRALPYTGCNIGA